MFSRIFSKQNIYCKYIPFICTWYYIGAHEKKDINKYMFTSGYNLSQKFKRYSVWDNYVEPFLIKQFAILFSGGNSFIKGMISDNENNKDITNSVQQLKNDIIGDLDELTNSKK